MYHPAELCPSGTPSQLGERRDLLACSFAGWFDAAARQHKNPRGGGGGGEMYVSADGVGWDCEDRGGVGFAGVF